MGNLFASGYLLAFLAAGYLAVRHFLPKEDPELTIPLGCGFAVAMLAAFPAIFAVFIGFTVPAVLLGGLGALALAFWLWQRKPPAVRPSKDWKPLLACVLPLFAVTCLLLHTHILHEVDGVYHTGQSGYGDPALHLAFIKNIAVTGTFPPLFPLLAGEVPIGYPFLCETVSSCFLLLGAGLRFAYLLPMLPALLAVYGMAWQLAKRILDHAGKACLAFWLFFMGSGFGFFYFLDSKEDFASIFTGFYTTPTNYTDKNILWVNPVVDLLVPQRATLFGWCLLFPALYLLWRFCMEEQPRLWLPLALLVLPLPLMQTHSALALVLLCLACGFYTLCFRPRVKAVLLPWGALALLCGVVWLCIGWGTVFSHALGGQQMIRLHFNWSNGSDDGALTNNYFWFYIKNIGVVYLLLLPAFLHAGRRQRWFYGGALGILALAEFVEFQTNNYDNNKLLFIWHLLGCLLVANLLWDLLAAVRQRPVRVYLAAGVVFLATFGSVLTLGRELVSDYWQWGPDDITLASYVDENAEATALFLTDDSHLQPVVCLAGRQIVCGSATFVYFHGMDYSAEENAAGALYTSPSTDLLAEWGVDYVVFSSGVSNKWPSSDENWYSDRYPLWYQNDSYRVYHITP